MAVQTNAVPIGILNELVDNLTRVRFEDLPSDVVERCKLFIIDSLGVTIAGATAPGCKEVVDLVKGWGGKPEATILVYGGKAPSPFAALANSTMMHALDFDDTLDESALHAHVTVFPAALAVAEAVGNISGPEIINAVNIGVDLVCRLGLSIKRPLSWVRTATCGSFGAAAAAAKILGLSKDQTLNALGIVYSQTAGNAQCIVDGGLVKRMQPAFSSKAGVISAHLAEKGITGAKDPFGGEYGFFNLYEKGQYDPQRITSDLGERFEIMGLSIKPYPSCRMTHASIDAALAINRAHQFDPSRIREVLVYASKMVYDMVGSPFKIKTDPQVDAQFSVPYTVATALIRGNVFLNDFKEEFIKDTRVLELAKKVRVIIDPAIPEKDMMHANVIVKTVDDREYAQSIDKIKGNPLNPMSIDDCIEKFKKCAAFNPELFPEDRVNRVIDCITNIEKLEDVSDLMEFFK